MSSTGYLVTILYALAAVICALTLPLAWALVVMLCLVIVGLLVAAIVTLGNFYKF